MLSEGNENEEVKTFEGLGICKELVVACDKLGWKNPSKIQAEAIPHALEGFCSLCFLLFYLSNINAQVLNFYYFICMVW